MKRIWLVADDYGISKSVNRAIRDLLSEGRLSATSVMTPAPAFDNEEARLLSESVRASGRAIGLHLTLTSPFGPLSLGYRPTQRNKFLPLGKTFAAALLGHLDRDALAAEIRTQIKTFVGAFGRPPDFIDGHQHVQLLPPVADSLLDVMQTETPKAWVRQCGRAPDARGFDSKAVILDMLSRSFRQRAAQRGVRTNAAFAGTYSFRADAKFENLFPKFLDSLPDGGLVMCHPGIVDDTLVALDPLTTLREREYDYFRSADFTAALSARAITLR